MHYFCGTHRLGPKTSEYGEDLYKVMNIRQLNLSSTIPSQALLLIPNINYAALETLSKRASIFIPTMYAPPCWGLARQEHARSPPITHCNWTFLPAFWWKKSAKQSSRQSKSQQNALLSPSRAGLLDLKKNQFCVDFSVDAQPNEATGMAPKLKNSSDVGSDNSDSENAEKVASDSKSETNPPISSSSTPLTSPAPEHGQLDMPNTIPRTSISSMYKEPNHDLPGPTEAHLCVYRRMKTLEYDEHGEPYFRITRGAINISSLPPEEQNAAYYDMITETVSIRAFGSGSADVPGPRNRGGLEQYGLHLTRLSSTKSSIRDLTLQNRTDGNLPCRYSMTPWDRGVLRDEKKGAATAHHKVASSAFSKRAVDERSITRLLDCCEGSLKHDSKFNPVPWRAHSSSLPRKRCKEERGGRMGVGPDDFDWQIARKGDDALSAEQAETELKRAFSRAAARATGKKRNQSGLFGRARTPGLKTHR